MWANSRICPYREEVSPSPTLPGYALECEYGGEKCWIKGMRVIPLGAQSQQNGSSSVNTVLLIHAWKLVKPPAYPSRAIMSPYLRKRQRNLCLRGGLFYGSSRFFNIPLPT